VIQVWSVMVHCGGLHKLLTSSSGCQRMANPPSVHRLWSLQARKGTSCVSFSIQILSASLKLWQILLTADIRCSC